MKHTECEYFEPLENQPKLCQWTYGRCKLPGNPVGILCGDSEPTTYTCLIEAEKAWKERIKQ